MLQLLIGFVAWFWNCVHAGWLVRSSWISKEHDVTHYGSLIPIQVNLRNNHQRLIFACVIPVAVLKKTELENLVVDWMRNICPWKLSYSRNTKTTKYLRLSTTNLEVTLNVKWKPRVMDLVSLKFLPTIACVSFRVKKFTPDSNDFYRSQWMYIFELLGHHWCLLLVILCGT